MYLLFFSHADFPAIISSPSEFTGEIQFLSYLPYGFYHSGHRQPAKGLNLRCGPSLGGNRRPSAPPGTIWFHKFEKNSPRYMDTWIPIKWWFFEKKSDFLKKKNTNLFGIYKFLDYFWGNRFFHRQPKKQQHKKPPEVRGRSPHDLQQSSCAPQNGSGVTVEWEVKGGSPPLEVSHPQED